MRPVRTFRRRLGSSPAPTLRKIGFCHFGSSHPNNRISSLKTSLMKAAETTALDDALIVIPEAFNIHGGYLDNLHPRLLDSSIYESLLKLSSELKAAFVAGLIVNGGRQPQYSCAYLIDGEISKLLSCKKDDDKTGNYDPCMFDCDQPLLHRGACLAALICMDASNGPDSERGMQLLNRVRHWRAANQILSIPSHMSAYNSQSVAAAWAKHVHVVLANSYPWMPSVIHLRGADQPLLFQDSDDQVKIVSLYDQGSPS